VSELKRRSDAFDKLASLEKVPVEVKKADGASASESVTLNEEIIRRVAAHNRTLGGGAEAIYEAAVRRNRGCDGLVDCKTYRHTLTPGLEAVLPAPKDASRRDVAMLRESEFATMERAREGLMKSFGADTAPKPGAVLEHVQSGRLSLDGLITHRHDADAAGTAYRQAFGDADCLKMILDWRYTA